MKELKETKRLVFLFSSSPLPFDFLFLFLVSFLQLPIFMLRDKRVQRDKKFAFLFSSSLCCSIPVFMLRDERVQRDKEVAFLFPRFLLAIYLLFSFSFFLLFS
jgi:hypothetical protein